MNILALDLGNTTGWAFVDSNGRRTSGVWKLHNPLCDGLRFLRLRTNIYAIHEEFGIHHIVYERVRRHEGTQAAHVYGGYLAIVHLFGHENNVTVAGTEVKSLKVHATGMGAAHKNDMVAAAWKKGWKPSDHNEADAMWLLDLAIATSPIKRKEKTCLGPRPGSVKR